MCINGTDSNKSTNTLPDNEAYAGKVCLVYWANCLVDYVNTVVNLTWYLRVRTKMAATAKMAQLSLLNSLANQATPKLPSEFACWTIRFSAFRMFLVV